MKMGELKKQAAMHHVLLLQETHGESGDSATFARELVEFITCFSPGATSGVGGVTIAIRKSILKQFDYINEVVITIGRAMAVHLSGPRGSISFISVHINPAMNYLAKCRAMDAVHAALPDLPSLWIMGGDWNHEAMGDSRFNAIAGEHIHRHEPEAE